MIFSFVIVVSFELMKMAEIARISIAAFDETFPLIPVSGKLNLDFL